jgi:hypothetical protein
VHGLLPLSSSLLLNYKDLPLSRDCQEGDSLFIAWPYYQAIASKRQRASSVTVTMARMQSSSTRSALRCPQPAAEFGEKSQIAMLYRIE